MLSILLGMIEADVYHMCYTCTFHPQGKNRSHADFTEGIAEALLAFETGSKSGLKTTSAKHSSNNIDHSYDAKDMIFSH